MIHYAKGKEGQLAYRAEGADAMVAQMAVAVSLRHAVSGGAKGLIVTRVSRPVLEQALDMFTEACLRESGATEIPMGEFLAAPDAERGEGT